MADAEEKARQEKIAAAKKRVEQRKKKKDKKAADAPKDDIKEESADAAEDGVPEVTKDDVDAAKDSAIEDKSDDSKADESEPTSALSLAEQSKARSTSFRASSISGMPASPGPLSPDGDTAPDIYRKHVARIEELEKENKRLQREYSDSEKRWKKTENELADLREADDRKNSDDTEKLKGEIASLERKNTQLQQQISRGSGHAHRQSVSTTSPPPALQAELDSKTSTIESMEIEISKLRSQLERHQSGASSEKEQVAALEDKVARAEAAAGKAQRELQDVKKNLERATEKAVREGSERSSAETKASTLEHELTALRATHEELAKKADGFEKKAATLTTLHKEQDARSQVLKREKDKAEAELAELRTRVEKLEGENTKLRSRKSADGGGGLDDEGMDELENEERERLEKKIRALEKEVHELRSGEWIQRRRDMESSSGFQDVDLSAPYGSPAQRKNSSGGIGQFLTNGLNALAGGGDDDDEGLLEDDDAEFDEEAFRKAHEEEQMRRLERIKELKRALKHWEGWRLDIVDLRRGGVLGVGDIFDV
ncbi:hypothetical protein BBO_01087 [Beauveria brongniartii RCEF 3172]|uniref:M protein repeat protein n=1 Tax=Beauveria brongniartii RCEF 3172 TaxID=1081107 RepID=A0A162M5F3_9HYPO|nr:hypothetical protein BBO_01087 [Beauveria brongniartii RCEF 3172]